MKTIIEKTKILERIKEAYSMDKDADLALFLGVSRSTLSNWGNRNSIDFDLVFSKCESLNFDWLLTGHGSMLRTEQAQPAPQPAVHPVVQQDLSGEAAAYYKMYEKEKEENKIKVEELTTKMLQMAEEIGNLKAQAGTQKEPQAPDHPPLAFDSGFVEAFTEAPSGGSTKDYAHMRKPTTIKKSSASKT